jgi:homoserine O-acetyltransferase
MPAGLGAPASSRALDVGPFTFESGASLPSLPLAFNTYGTLAADGRNAVLVGHSLTSNSCVHEWWAPLLGAGPSFLLDTERYFVVCVNLLGSVYGSAGPLTRDATGAPYGAGFPVATVRDNARAQLALLAALGVRGVAAAVGGSLGGMVALEAAALAPALVRELVLIASCAAHPAWAIAQGAAGRAAIYADPLWRGGAYAREGTPPPLDGLAVARAFAMLSYKTPASLEEKFGRALDARPAAPASPTAPARFAVESYLAYQGDKFRARFDPAAYVRLTQLLDSHDVGRARAGGAAAVLAALPQRALVVGIDSDGLYPLAEQRALAAALPHAEMLTLESPHGHDAFLIHLDDLNAAACAWRDARERPALKSTVIRGGLR